MKMPIRPDLQQLEKCIDDFLRKNDFKPLKSLLQMDVYEDVKIKCSKQFLNKLDDLICRELNKKDSQTVSTILVSVGRCIKNICILGQIGLLIMLKQGLVQKEMIVSQGNSKEKTIANMVEDLFDLLMVVHGISDEGKRQVIESFVPRICALVIDSRVNICFQQETLKKMNAMLDKMPRDARKILFSKEMLILMRSMGKRILDAGDYELQVSIVEALCRMTTPKQRQELACQWFSMDFIINAFKEIKDSEFETDCRIFLNFVNGILGDKRRVFTFPCLSAFLDKYELKIPLDENLEEFWIDFNLGSQTLSFFVADDDDQWESVTVPEERVQIYTVEVKESKKLLTIILKTIVKISKIAGKQLLFYFDASLDIINVTQKIFGANKYREFTKKQSFSIAKTSVHVIFDESGSQNPVPKSQNSPVRDLSNLKEKSDSQIEIAKLLKCTKNSLHGESKNNQPQIVKHRKRKISEASIIVPGSDRYTVRSPIFLINTPTERRKRSKSPVPVMRSIEKPDLCRTLENKVDNAVSMKSRPSEGRKRDNISDKVIQKWAKNSNKLKNSAALMKPAQIVGKQTEKDIESPNQSFNELSDMPPDSQTVGKIGESMLPGVLNSCGNKMQSKLACWTPIMNIKLCKKQQESASSEDSFNQEIVLNKNHTKEKSSTSISDDNYEETERMPERKEIMKQSKKEKAEIEDLERNCQQGLNYSKQKNIAYTNQSGCLIEPEITLKSVHLNKTIEESLTYRKRYILSKDVTHDASEKSPRKSAESHTRQSRKGSTSKLNSWVLEKVKKKEESKENRFTDAAESLINQINKRYTPKESMLSARRSKESSVENDFSNKSDLLLRKEKVQKKTYRQLKTTLVNVAPQCPLNDVYNFNLNGADEPVIKLGIQELQATEAYMENSIKLTGLRNHNNTLKTKDKRVKNQKSKNVFSDSDTEIRCDDSKTDVSWLKEPKKPQLMDYSRTAKEKRRKPTKAKYSPEKGQPRSKKKTPSKKNSKKIDETVPDRRTRLPRRATKTKRNYKDLSNSEPESEEEFSPSFKEKLLVKENNIHSRRNVTKLPKKKQNAFTVDTQKELSKELKNLALVKDAAKDDHLDLMPLSGNSSTTEAMKYVEERTERVLTHNYDRIRKFSSPYQKIPSPESVKNKSGVEGSTESPINHEKNFLHTRKCCSPIPKCFSLESSSQSSLFLSSNRREKAEQSLPPVTTTQESGPTHLTRKRLYLEDNLSNLKETEEQEEGRGSCIPAKQSKTEDLEPHFDPRNNLCIPEEHWEVENSNVEMIYEKANTEIKKKVKIHEKLMKYFTKESWKTAQQHVNSVKHHIQEYRIKKLDKFQFIIIEELEKFERDSQTLKNLEQEFAEFWEKIYQKFTSYQKCEQQRLHLLKTSLEKNVFYNTDYEETVFKAEMCSMKEDMKMLQERLLKEMQEEDLLNVRKGLVSLFMTYE